MQLVRNQEEWDKLKATITEEHGIPESAVSWCTPQEYPFMLDYFVSEGHVHVCLMYVADAVMLCQAAGMVFDTTSDFEYEDEDEDEDEDGEDFDDEGQIVIPINTVGPDQYDFNFNITAHLMTMVNFLVETGICSRQQYEETLARVTTEVDQIFAESTAWIRDMFRSDEPEDEDE